MVTHFLLDKHNTSAAKRKVKVTQTSDQKLRHAGIHGATKDSQVVMATNTKEHRRDHEMLCDLHPLLSRM